MQPDLSRFRALKYGAFSGQEGSHAVARGRVGAQSAVLDPNGVDIELDVVDYDTKVNVSRGQVGIKVAMQVCISLNGEG